MQRENLVLLHRELKVTVITEVLQLFKKAGWEVSVA